jgi:hypothetical protein
MNTNIHDNIEIQIWEYEKKESFTIFKETLIMKLVKKYFHISYDFSKFVFYINKLEQDRIKSYLEIWDLQTAASLYSIQIDKRRYDSLYSIHMDKSRYDDKFKNIFFTDIYTIAFSRDSTTIAFQLDIYLFYMTIPASVDNIMDLMSQKNIPPEVVLTMITKYISNNTPPKKLVSKTYKRALNNKKSSSKSISNSKTKSK